VRRSIVRPLIAALSLVFVLSFAASAVADPPADSPSREGRTLGIEPSHGQAAKFARTNTSNLSYHGGPVMLGNHVYAIYWVPPGYSVSSNYESLINRYFGGVAADSGKTSNVYFSDTQYSSIPYSTSFAGSVVDTHALPASGCRDRYTPVCVTDGQIQTELGNVMKSQGWSAGPNNIFFVFTAKNIGSCAGSACSFSYYCAYHSWIGSGPTETLYANMPYADTVPAACDSGQHPNGDDADATLNVTSHEHNETITDPLGSAWYDRNGNENGDKCAWNFGTSIGSTSTTSASAYNQVIGANPYYLQQEWSNASSGCVLTGT
jgi:hypothetical protein